MGAEEGAAERGGGIPAEAQRSKATIVPAAAQLDAHGPAA
jgi:hypothetical protein